jgi:lipopolysaccharide biosynthesis regulator YciM
MSQQVKRVRRKRVKSLRHGEGPLRFGRIALWLLLIAMAFGLGFLLLSGGPKLYHQWRESRLLQRANILLQEERFNEASRVAHQALLIRSDSLRAFYILAEATEKQNRSETVAWRAQIARLSPRDLDSQLNLASAALRFGQLDTARKALENVRPEERDKAAYHVVAGWLARAQGNEADVEQHFAAAVKQEPGNDLYQFNLAVIQIRSPDENKRADARTTLHRLSRISEFRTGALRALLTDAVRKGDFSAADDLAQGLQMSQQVTFADYLLCLDFYKKLNEKKFVSLLDKVKPVAARTPGDLALLMDWMNRNGLAAEVLKWMEKLDAEITTKAPPAITIAEAFVQVKNWSRLKRWTRSGDWGEAEDLRLAYQAYGARQARQTAAEAEFDSLWNSAVRAAGERPDHQATLARLAIQWQLKFEAEQLWLQVAKHPPHRREALDALYTIYRANNDLPKLYETARRLHESSPREPGAVANRARLALIVEQNTKDGQRFAKEAYDLAPNDTNCAVTYAFSLYSIGQTAQGIEVLKKLNPEQLQDPHAAVYTAVLLLDDNQTEAAQEYIAASKKGAIFPEEKKLLDEAISKISSAPSPAPSPPPPSSSSPSSSPSPSPPL